GKVYLVGGPELGGWKLQSDPRAYALWSARQQFKTTDVLWFNFTTGEDSVAEVWREEAYHACDIKDPIRLEPGGPDRFTLLTPGSHFICTKDQKFVACVPGR
uniref:Pollen allergen Amb a 3 n=1 Tax=Ambrosia artemisiifolia var. elatior TaxID=4215 RepID=MPAA3_AMBEL|nr:RecName: Full=Pollen allergen Amb a 3; AltName: Full=Allergen Amb a III; AltName: Full=Allergen Ra3; AltName: Allergen=Amb a 3 [Ambrosia artemisiifolia var. elatior]